MEAGAALSLLPDAFSASSMACPASTVFLVLFSFILCFRHP